MATRGSLASLLIASMLLAVATAPLRAANESAVAPELAVYSGLVPDDAFFAMHFHLRRVLASESLAKLGINSLFEDMIEHTGFSPTDLDQVAMLVGPVLTSNSRRHGEPKIAILGRFSKPHDPAKMAAKWMERRKVEEFELSGHKCFRAAKQPNSFGPSDEPNVCFLDGRTFVMVSESWLPDVLAAKGARSPLISALAAGNHGADGTIAFASTDAAKGMIAQELAGSLIGPMKSIGDAVELLQTARLSVFTDPEISLKLTIVGKDQASAAEIAKLVRSVQQMSEAMLSAVKVSARSEELPADERAARELALTLAKKLVDGLTPRQTGEQVTVEIGGICTVDTLVGKLILPATAADRLATQRFHEMNNLKELAFAMLTSHQNDNHFPAHAIYSKAGKPLLSWRVQLLPLLDQAELYKQFHLDEPWDSEHNKAVIAKMPAVFSSGNKLLLVEGKTRYVVPVGKNTIFDGDKGIGVEKITDGMSNTILILETGEDKAVVWTKPDDMDFDPQKPLAGLGKIDEKGTQAAFADGHVQMLRKKIDAETFRRLILRNDGKPVDQSKL